MEAVAFQLFQQFCAEAGLKQGLAAGKGDPAVVAVKDPVLDQLFKCFVHGDVFSVKFQCAVEADLLAFPAGGTIFAVEKVLSRCNFVIAAYFRAIAAGGTFVQTQRQFRFHFPAFRIVTPDASQGTALEKKSRPDPGPVMDCEALYVNVRNGGHKKNSAVKLFKSDFPFRGTGRSLLRAGRSLPADSGPSRCVYRCNVPPQKRPVH